MLTENELSNIIIGESIYIHKTLGPGLLEPVYKECLYYKLLKRELNVVKEKAVPLIFEEIKMECGYRADLIVEQKVIVEINKLVALFFRRWECAVSKYPGCIVGSPPLKEK